MSSRMGAHSLGQQRGTQFRVWAPAVQSIELELPERGTRVAMSSEGGVFSCEVRDAQAGTDYWYLLDGYRARPDPRSCHQPAGVHGPSRVIDPQRFRWSDAGFACPALEAFVIYELHIGTFSAPGSFDGAIAQLPHLKELGVTAVEVMPIAQFPGARNWGYDGVFPFAVQASYGGPEAFARFVDACHAHGLAVMLDVVYNHLGPEGNYLGEFGPYFTDRYKTDWGQAINYDGPDSDPVRRYFIDNALFWLRDYHVDALRLDAVHAIYDLSARHILEELRDEVALQAQQLRRPAYLIAESDLNDVRVIRPVELGGYGLHAQWSDDFHHALRTLLSPDRSGYLADFGKVADLARAYTQGFVYAGAYSPFRRRRHGNSSLDRPGKQFVVYQQNHDQIGNTSQGERVSQRAGFDKAKLGAVAVAVAPNLPLLFMGEEFFAQTPFAYFVNHGDSALNEAVRRGRLAEHAHFGAADSWLDPTAEATFAACKLDWSSLEAPEAVQMRCLYRDLYALRRQYACLGGCDKRLTRASWNDDELWLVVERAADSGELALCVLNFAPLARSITPPEVRGSFRLALATSHARYGGIGAAAHAETIDVDGHNAERFELGPHSAAIYLLASSPAS